MRNLMSRYTVKIPANIVHKLDYYRKDGLYKIRELFGIPEEWSAHFRYRDLNPFTVASDRLTFDIFEMSDNDPVYPQYYCQLWVPYELEQLTDPRWAPPKDMIVEPEFNYPAAEQLVWDDVCDHWLHIVPDYTRASTTPALLLNNGVMAPLFDKFKDKILDDTTPAFIRCDAGWRWEPTGDKMTWVQSEPPVPNI